MSFFTQPLQVSTLSLQGRVFIAPLAGITDQPFRRILQECGASLTFVEMVSATALTYDSQKTWDMMKRHEKEEILGLQIFGKNSYEISKSLNLCLEKEFNIYDINMGCPARKVVSAGCGSFLLQNPSLVRDILKNMRLQTKKPLSAKIRAGYTRDQENVELISQIVAEENFDLLTIHGRTRSEGYSLPVNIESIKKGVLSAKNVREIPIIANGDVFSWQDAHYMIENTKADGVMLARGILGNPWLIQEILQQTIENVTLQKWKELVFRHIFYQKEYYGNTEQAAILMRKQLLWYCTGFYGIKALRNKLNNILSLDEAQNLIEDFSSTLPLETIRIHQPHVLSQSI